MGRFLIIAAVVVSFMAVQSGDVLAWGTKTKAKTKEEMLNSASDMDAELEKEVPDPVEPAPEPAARKKAAPEKTNAGASTAIMHQQPGAEQAKQAPAPGAPAVPAPVTASKAAAPEKKDKGKCYVATAAYGSYLDPHVYVLREFRDTVLLTNTIGRTFVELYYSYSPPAASFIGRHGSLRAMTRWALTPVIFGIEYPRWAMCGLVLFIGFVIVARVPLRRRNP